MGFLYRQIAPMVDFNSLCMVGTKIKFTIVSISNLIRTGDEVKTSISDGMFGVFIGYLFSKDDIYFPSLK